MDRDILSILISTIASESAFDDGDRVLDQYLLECAYSSETVDALICLRDWLFGVRDIFSCISISIIFIDGINIFLLCLLYL